MKKVFLLLSLTLITVIAAYGAAAPTVSLSDHPLMNKKNIAMLNLIAQRVSDIIDSKFPEKEQVIIGLGQSPAYLLKMIELIDRKHERIDRSYIHVAFSGFCSCLKDGIFNAREALTLSNNEPYYISYLQKLKLSPHNLEDGRSYIVLEICNTGKGLNSFLNFFHGYKERPGIVYLKKNKHFKLKQHGFKQKGMLIGDEVEIKLITFLANADKFDDRLVPHFPMHTWKSVNPFDFIPKKNAQLIIKNLEDYVANDK